MKEASGGTCFCVYHLAFGGEPGKKEERAQQDAKLHSLANAQPSMAQLQRNASNLSNRSLSPKDTVDRRPTSPADEVDSIGVDGIGLQRISRT